MSTTRPDPIITSNSSAIGTPKEFVLTPRSSANPLDRAWEIIQGVGKGNTKTVFAAMELNETQRSRLLERTPPSSDTRRFILDRSPNSPTESPQSFTSLNSPSMHALSFTPLSEDQEEVGRRVQKLIREFDISRFCKGNGIEGVVKTTAIRRIPDENSVFIVSEFCDGGDLFSYFKESKEIENTKKLLKMVVETVRALHQNEIVHWDIKPENILLKEGLPKLGDFECSYKIDDPKFRRLEQTEGTWFYRSPMPRGIHESAKSRDIFALGATLFYALTGGKILAENILKKQGLVNDDGELLQKDRNLGMHWVTNTTNKDICQIIDEARIDERAADLLKKMLYIPSHEEYDRGFNEFTIKEVLSHPFFE